MVYVGYYLDQWAPPARTDVDWASAPVMYGYIESWRSFYAFDPVTSPNISAADAARVLGGVASAWGDQVDSAVGATGMLYPRALAIGEKLWSPAAATAVDSQQDAARLDPIAARLERARCRLAQRGIGAHPVDIAGRYGFCWSPKWAEGGGGGGGGGGGAAATAGGDTIEVSSAGGAAVVLAAAAAGAAIALAWAHRAAIAGACNKLGEAADEGGGASTAGQVAAPSGSAGPRFVALDQMRGLTIVAMLFVNLNYGFEQWLPPFFWHGITYFSGPDLVEPAFHFCVGYSLRLVLPRRIEAARRAGAPGWLGARWAVLRALLATRVAGLIVVSIFFTEGWAAFDSWADVGGLSGWLTQVVQSVKPYHTLTHIAFITIWCFPAMSSESWRARAAMLVATAALHCLLHASFYFQWIATYGLDEGGYFGFVGWSVEALAGALAHDLIAHAQRAEAEGAAVGAKGAESAAAATEAAELAAPLLAVVDGGPRASLNNGGGGGGGGRGGGSSGGGSASSSGSASGGAIGVGPQQPSGGLRPHLALAAVRLCGGAAALMSAAYLLSCLGAHPSPALNPVCFNGTRIYFWGGFGDAVRCDGVPTLGGGGLVLPPFAQPDPDTNVVTMWTMTQRAGSPTYHIFAAGTSAAILALFVAASELGCAARWRPGGAAAQAAGAALGLRTDQDGRVRFRSHVFEVFGENALTIYIAGDQVGDAVQAMVPPDAPTWYFLLFGECTYIGVLFVCALYLRSHKLFLRL